MKNVKLGLGIASALATTLASAAPTAQARKDYTVSVNDLLKSLQNYSTQKDLSLDDVVHQYIEGSVAERAEIDTYIQAMSPSFRPVKTKDGGLMAIYDGGWYE